MTETITASPTETNPTHHRGGKQRVSRKREALLNTAVKLFYEEGYHAVGIDRILDEANVSKPTLYAHFKSKDDLIVASLRKRDTEAREEGYQRMLDHADDPRQRLLFLFEWLGNWVKEPDFKGCLFINASAEFACHDNPVHQAAAEHKRAYRNMIAEQARLAGARDPQHLADRLMLLIDGLIVTCQVAPNPSAVRAAKELASMLIDASLSQTTAA